MISMDDRSWPLLVMSDLAKTDMRLIQSPPEINKMIPNLLRAWMSGYGQEHVIAQVLS